MNLHEECLLKYLSNPLGVAISTELLRQYNDIIMKTQQKGAIIAKTSQLSYITTRN